MRVHGVLILSLPTGSKPLPSNPNEIDLSHFELLKASPTHDHWVGCCCRAHRSEMAASANGECRSTRLMVLVFLGWLFSPLSRPRVVRWLARAASAK